MSLKLSKLNWPGKNSGLLFYNHYPSDLITPRLLRSRHQNQEWGLQQMLSLEDERVVSASTPDKEKSESSPGEPEFLQKPQEQLSQGN